MQYPISHAAKYENTITGGLYCTGHEDHEKPASYATTALFCSCHCLHHIINHRGQNP